MKPWIKLAVLFALAVAVAQLWVRRPSHPAVGASAPDVALPDLEGRTVRLSDLRGRVVAVNFWATWCAPCLQEIPALGRVRAAHRDECFELLGIAAESGPRADVQAAAARLGIAYPVLVDVEGKAGDAFRIPAYPRTFLLDAEGKVRTVFEGAVEQPELERALAPLLADAPKSCPRA